MADETAEQRRERLKARLAELQELKRRQEIAETSTPLNAFLRNAAQGATAGYSDEISAATKSAGPTGGILGFTRSEEPLLGGTPSDRPTYEDALAAEREQLDVLNRTHPTASLLGNLAGGAASFYPGSQAMLGANFLNRVVMSGALGAISGAGYADEDRLRGAFFGGVTGAALPVLGAGASKAGQVTDDVMTKGSALAQSFFNRGVGGSSVKMDVLRRWSEGLKDIAESKVKSAESEAKAMSGVSKLFKADEKLVKEIPVTARLRMGADEIATVTPRGGGFPSTNEILRERSMQGVAEQAPSSLSGLGNVLGIVPNLFSPVTSTVRLLGKEPLREAGTAVLPGLSVSAPSLYSNPNF